MYADFRKEIEKVVSRTKIHKDAFAVRDLVTTLRRRLEAQGDSVESLQEQIIDFVADAAEVLAGSRIYSEALMRAFYRDVLDLSVSMGIAKEGLLEDLLFQSLRRRGQPEKTSRRKQDDPKGRILQAALAEFSENGFYHSTIDSIAERAGIAKGTVYRYFRTKEELFSALKENTISEFSQYARRGLEHEEDILKVIEKVITAYLGFFEKNSAFFKVLMQEQKDFGREFSEKFINELILALPGLKRRCWKASREGQLKQMNYFTVFYGIVGFMNGVIQKWLHEGGEGSLTAEVETVKDVLFYGFALPSQRHENTHPFKVVS